MSALGCRLLLAWALIVELTPLSFALEWQPDPSRPAAAPRASTAGWRPAPGGSQATQRLRWNRSGPPDGVVVAPMGLAWQPVPAGEVIDLQAEQEREALARALEEEPKLPPPLLASPYIGGGLPTAYTAAAGDWWAALSGGTPGNLRGGVVDGSASVGVGFGNAFETLSLGLTWNVGSINYLNANGGFDAALSRALYTSPGFELMVGGGAMNLWEYGNETGSYFPNLYGVVSASTVLRKRGDFKQVLTFSGGVGGNNFAYLNADFTGPTTGYFAAAGLELSRHFGTSIGYSGRGGNISLSYVPFPRQVPLSVNLLAADVFNSSPYGTIGILTLAFGGNLYRQGRFSFW